MTTDLRMHGRAWQVLGILEENAIQENWAGLTRIELAGLLKVKPNTASAYLHVLSRHGLAKSSNIGRYAKWTPTGRRTPVLREVSEKNRASGLARAAAKPPAPKRRPPNSVFALGSL